MTDRYSVCSARVHRIAREHHLEAALIVRKGIPICVGLDTTGAGGSGSAVVNALQNCDERLGDADVYVTYAPTEADLGMAWLFRIKAIFVQVGSFAASNARRFMGIAPRTIAATVLRGANPV